jgi:hypothetical protein
MYFFHATGGMDWRNKKDWATGTAVREWYGIVLNSEGDIAEIKMENNHLKGTLFFL